MIVHYLNSYDVWVIFISVIYKKLATNLVSVLICFNNNSNNSFNIFMN